MLRPKKINESSPTKRAPVVRVLIDFGYQPHSKEDYLVGTVGVRIGSHDLDVSDIERREYDPPEFDAFLKGLDQMMRSEPGYLGIFRDKLDLYGCWNFEFMHKHTGYDLYDFADRVAARIHQDCPSAKTEIKTQRYGRNSYLFTIIVQGV